MNCRDHTKLSPALVSTCPVLICRSETGFHIRWLALLGLVSGHLPDLPEARGGGISSFFPSMSWCCWVCRARQWDSDHLTRTGSKRASSPYGITVPTQKARSAKHTCMHPTDCARELQSNNLESGPHFLTQSFATFSSIWETRRNMPTLGMYISNLRSSRCGVCVCGEREGHTRRNTAWGPPFVHHLPVNFVFQSIHSWDLFIPGMVGRYEVMAR
jgi:hypothetical protein